MTTPSIPFVYITEEIRTAAQTLHIYFEKKGLREWEFSTVADSVYTHTPEEIAALAFKQANAMISEMDK